MSLVAGTLLTAAGTSSASGQAVGEPRAAISTTPLDCGVAECSRGMASYSDTHGYVDTKRSLVAIGYFIAQGPADVAEPPVSAGGVE